MLFAIGSYPTSKSENKYFLTKNVSYHVPFNPFVVGTPTYHAYSNNLQGDLDTLFFIPTATSLFALKFLISVTCRIKFKS